MRQETPRPITKPGVGTEKGRGRRDFAVLCLVVGLFLLGICHADVGLTQVLAVPEKIIEPALLQRSMPSTEVFTPSLWSESASRQESSEAQAPDPGEAKNSPPLETDLVSAHRDGLIDLQGRGRGLQSLELDIELEITQPVRVEIQPGTVFQPTAGSAQAMVLREGRTVTLTLDRPRLELTLEAACGEMHADVPGADDQFVLEAPPKGDLAKLLRLPEFSRAGFRVQQFAIWTITDNPRRGSYVGLGSFGFGSGPSDEEMQEIRQLFQKAGIPLDRYRAL